MSIFGLNNESSEHDKLFNKEDDIMSEFAKETSQIGQISQQSQMSRNQSTVYLTIIVSKIELGYNKKGFNVTLDNVNTGGEPEILMMTLTYKENPQLQVGQKLTITIS